jgi:pimeloyl-ACP methyl ester carboxylesterase
VIVDGLAVFAERGDQARGTVIAVHGGLDRAASFRRLARRLDDLDLVAYDRRGYQGSRGLPHPDLAHHTDDLLAVARTMQDKPVVVLGHSYGGVVALNAALAEPRLFHALVVYEPPLPFVYRREGWGSTPIADDPGDEAESFFRRMVSDSAWDRLSPTERDGRRADGPALVDDLRTIRGDAPFDLAHLTVPTIYGHGDALHADYYAEVGARLKALNPLITPRVVQHAGHGAHLTSPDQFAHILEELV